MIKLGTFKTKIVGVKHYGGITSKGEIVTAVREPHNTFDKNATKIFFDDNEFNAEEDEEL